jgi:hypothetical protein
MNINWVLSNRVVIDPTVDIDRMKELGSFWGGWKTWRACQTDNVICHDMARAHDLILKQFHQTCNFYMPNSFFVNLGRPPGVKLYQGDFAHEVQQHEEIVAMHLAAINCDIVLLLGFDFGEPVKLEDKMAEHQAHNYRSLTKQVIIDTPQVQWLLIDHPDSVRKDLQGVQNLDTDTLTNVLGLLSN